MQPPGGLGVPFFVFWFLVFGFGFLVFGFLVLGFGFWFLVFGFLVLVFGFWFLVFGFRFLVFGFWLRDLGLGFRVLGFGVVGSGFHQLLHRLAWVPVPGFEFGLNPSRRFKTIKTIKPRKKGKGCGEKRGGSFDLSQSSCPIIMSQSPCPDHHNGFAIK